MYHQRYRGGASGSGRSPALAAITASGVLPVLRQKNARAWYQLPAGCNVLETFAPIIKYSRTVANAGAFDWYDDRSMATLERRRSRSCTRIPYNDVRCAKRPSFANGMRAKNRSKAFSTRWMIEPGM